MYYEALERDDMRRRAESIQDQWAASAGGTRGFKLAQKHVQDLERAGTARLKAADFGYAREVASAAPLGPPGGTLLAVHRRRSRSSDRGPKGGG
jgi:hypothetical protein